MTQIGPNLTSTPASPTSMTLGVTSVAVSVEPAALTRYTQTQQGLSVGPTVPGLGPLWTQVVPGPRDIVVASMAGAAAALSCFSADARVYTGMVVEGLVAIGILSGIGGVAYHYFYGRPAMERLVNQAFVEGSYNAQSEILKLVQERPERLQGVSLKPLADYWKSNVKNHTNLPGAARILSALLDSQHEGIKNEAQRLVGLWTKNDIQAAYQVGYFGDKGKFLDQLDALNLKVSVREVLVEALCDRVVDKCNKVLPEHHKSNKPALKSFIQAQVREMPLGTAGQVYQKLIEVGQERECFVSIETDEASRSVALVLGGERKSTDWNMVFHLLEVAQKPEEAPALGIAYRGVPKIDVSDAPPTLSDLRDQYLKSEGGRNAYESKLRSLIPSALKAELDTLFDLMTSETTTSSSRISDAYLMTLAKVQEDFGAAHKASVLGDRFTKAPADQGLLRAYSVTVARAGDVSLRNAALELLAGCYSRTKKDWDARYRYRSAVNHVMDEGCRDEVVEPWLKTLIDEDAGDGMMDFSEKVSLALLKKHMGHLRDLADSESDKEKKYRKLETHERLATVYYPRDLKKELSVTPPKYPDLGHFGEEPAGWIKGYLILNKADLQKIATEGVFGAHGVDAGDVDAFKDFTPEDAPEFYDGLSNATVLYVNKPANDDPNTVCLEVLLDPKMTYGASQECFEELRENIPDSRSYDDDGIPVVELGDEIGPNFANSVVKMTDPRARESTLYILPNLPIAPDHARRIAA